MDTLIKAWIAVLAIAIILSLIAGNHWSHQPLNCRNRVADVTIECLGRVADVTIECLGVESNMLAQALTISKLRSDLEQLKFASRFQDQYHYDALKLEMGAKDFQRFTESWAKQKQQEIIAAQRTVPSQHVRPKKP